MLRHACTLACDSGVQVIPPVHDQLLIEWDASDIFAATALTRECMNEAPRQVLDGVEVLIADTATRYPDGYRDEDGGPRWDLVNEKLAAFRQASTGS